MNGRKPLDRFAGAFVVAGLALASGSGLSADRALVMAIGNYADAPALPGVRLDAVNARKILKGIGFGVDHIREPDESALTLEGMKKELDALVHDTSDGDRVFVYFSGHGTSYSVGDRCEQALVSRDMKPLPATQVLQYLTALRDRASRVVVVLDSCFSGGVAEAAVQSDPNARSLSKLTPKYWKALGQTGCSTAINVASEGVRGLRAAKGAINLERNFVYLAAARSNEAAYDDSLTGGVASTAIIDCLSDPATDADHSGSVSFGELVGCAQKRVNTRESKDERLRQHLVLAGNDGMPVASAPQPVDARMNPKATLRDLMSAADARWSVQVVPSAQRLKIKQDSFTVRVTTNTSGFLYLFYVGSDNQEFLKLYPTASESNAIAAGVPFSIPKVWHSEGPPGEDHLLVVITPEPRDLDKVFGLNLSAPATYQSSNGLQDAFHVCRNLSEQSCAPGDSRNSSATDSVTSSNSALYGAALLIIEETTQ